MRIKADNSIWHLISIQYVSVIWKHNNAGYKSIFQGSSIFRAKKATVNKTRAKKEKQIRTELNNVSPNSQGQTVISTHHDNILILHITNNIIIYTHN